MFLALYTGVQIWWADLKFRSREEGGATAVEYALMVALIAAVIIVAVTALGNNASQQVHDGWQRNRRCIVDRFLSTSGLHRPLTPGCEGSEGPVNPPNGASDRTRRPDERHGSRETGSRTRHRRPITPIAIERSSIERGEDR